MRRTVKLDSIGKLQRWASQQVGQKLSIAQLLEWLEDDPYLKLSLSTMIVRDTVRLGAVSDVKKLDALGYDLEEKCAYQVDGNALHVAAQNNRQAHAQVLVDLGLSVKHRCFPAGPSALDEALTNGHMKLFGKLLAHAGPVDQAMKEGFFAAVMSSKVHAKPKSIDLMKKQTLLHVVEQFGAPPAAALSQGLHLAADHCWPSTFEALVGLGADPSLTGSFSAAWGAGKTTLLLALFSRAHPNRWEALLDRFASHASALFPSSQEDGKLWTLVDMAGAMDRHSQGYAQYDLPTLIAKTRACWTHKQLEDQLPDQPVPHSRRSAAPGRRL